MNHNKQCTLKFRTRNVNLLYFAPQPRTMIPDAVFRPETRRKRPVSGRNLRENGRNFTGNVHRTRMGKLRQEINGNSPDQAGSGRTATTWVFIAGVAAIFRKNIGINGNARSQIYRTLVSPKKMFRCLRNTGITLYMIEYFFLDVFPELNKNIEL